MEIDPNPIVLNIKVLQASNCKGSKASLNSFIRVQFADYDYKDVSLVTVTPLSHIYNSILIYFLFSLIDKHYLRQFESRIQF